MYKKAIVVFAMVIGIVIAGGAYAQTSTEALRTQIETLLGQIKNLQKQITGLQAQQRVVAQELCTTVQEFRFQLRDGANNEEVKLLQELLATDEGIYPEKRITGFFGHLTKKALVKFQLKHGIEGTGEVGPQTRRVLNAFLKEGHKKGMCVAISKHLLKKFDVASTSTDDGTHGRGKEKIAVCHREGNSGRSHTITIASPALNAHLSHEDSVGKCSDDHDDDDDTPPDSTAPIISSIHATSTTVSATHIVWVTNEAASSKVTYATTTPISSATFPVTMMNSSLVTSHDLLLGSLTASTTYYYLVSSKDVAENTATSSENQFTTAAE